MDSRRRFRGLDNLRTLKDRLEDSHKTNPLVPKDISADSRKTIPRDRHRRSATFCTDFHGNPRLSAQTFKENRDRIQRKSADFRK